MIKLHNGDIFKAPVDVIIHQANCFCTMRSGIAKQIRNKFPEAYWEDCKTKEGDKDKLGKFTKVITPRYIICNLYGQYDFGREPQKCYTNYWAVENGFTNIKSYLELMNLKKKVIGIPHFMSCALGGGDWNVYYKIIEKIFKNSEFEVLICKL